MTRTIRTNNLASVRENEKLILMKNCMWSFIFFIISSFSSLALLAQTASGDVTNAEVISVASVASQDTSSKVDGFAGIVCKTNYTEKRPRVIHEDYKQCVFKYIQDVFSFATIKKTEAEKKEFLVYVNQQLSDSKYYLEKTTSVYIKNLLSDPQFFPDEAVLNSLQIFYQNKLYSKQSFFEFNAELEKSYLLQMLACLENENVEIFNKRKFTKPIVTFVSELYRKKSEALLSQYNFKEFDYMNTELYKILFKTKGLYKIKQRLLNGFTFYYYNLGNYQKVLEYTEQLRKISDGLSPANRYRQTYAMMLLNKYTDCIESAESAADRKRTVEEIFSILKVKNYCNLELGHENVKNLLKNTVGLNYGKSADEFYNYKAELLIVDNKFNEAVEVLEKSTADYNIWRRIDLLTYQRKYAKALEIAEKNTQKNQSPNGLSNKMKMFLLYYLNGKKENYLLGLSKLIENCNIYMSYASKENVITFRSCEFAKLINDKSSRNEIRTLFVQQDFLKRRLFQHQIINSVMNNL